MKEEEVEQVEPETRPVRKREKKAIEKNIKLTNKTTGYFWKDEEKERFVKAIQLYGTDWDKVVKYVGTRTKNSI